MNSAIGVILPLRVTMKEAQVRISAGGAQS